MTARVLAQLAPAPLNRQLPPPDGYSKSDTVYTLPHETAEKVLRVSFPQQVIRNLKYEELHGPNFKGQIDTENASKIKAVLRANYEGRLASDVHGQVSNAQRLLQVKIEFLQIEKFGLENGCRITNKTPDQISFRISEIEKEIKELKKQESLVDLEYDRTYFAYWNANENYFKVAKKHGLYLGWDFSYMSKPEGLTNEHKTKT